jgi:hypothetical protein
MLTMRGTLLTASIAVALFGCSKDEPKKEGATSASASAPAAATPTPTPTPATSPTPSASASAAPEPPHECPPKSAGVGSLDKPCDAKGTERMMTVKYTKTTDDHGPEFSITNKSKLPILYGKIAIYFYDKAGKQLELPPDPSDKPPKPRRFLSCFGSNLFQGVMKPAENAALTFGCLPKSGVPEGTATMEGEITMVGFSDASEKKVDFYWTNKDLVPDARKKGGVK